MNTKKRWIIVIGVQMILLALGIMQAVYAQNHLTEEVFTGAAVPVYAQKQQGPGETTLELKRGSYEVELTYKAQNETMCQTEEVFTGAAVPVYAQKQQGPGETTLELKRGSYEVELTYKAQNETMCQPLMRTAYGEDYADQVLLLKEAEQKTFELMLYRDVTDFYLLSGDGTLQVEQLTIRRTARWNRMLCTMLVIGMLLADAYFWQKKMRFWEKLSPEKRSAAAAGAVIGVLASLPLFTNYLLNGADLSFHLMRIEGIAEGLRQGSFPVKMQPLWVNDYGYPVSVMYGDTLLYIRCCIYRRY